MTFPFGMAYFQVSFREGKWNGFVLQHSKTQLAKLDESSDRLFF